jgi:hypothetical protein
MNRSAKKQQHEQSRKKHRHDLKEYARELSRRKPSTTAAWVLGVGLAVVVAAVVGLTFLS